MLILPSCPQLLRRPVFSRTESIVYPISDVQPNKRTFLPYANTESRAQTAHPCVEIFFGIHRTCKSAMKSKAQADLSLNCTHIVKRSFLMCCVPCMYILTTIRGLNIHVRFSIIFHTGGTFCYFMFPFLHTNSF